MSDFHDYAFEEYEVTYKGQTCYAYGSFCVEYTVEDAQSDCGYPGGIEIVGYSDLSVEIDNEGDEWIKITDKEELADLLKQIIAQAKEDYICDEIEESF